MQIVTDHIFMSKILQISNQFLNYVLDPSCIEEPIKIKRVANFMQQNNGSSKYAESGS